VEIMGHKAGWLALGAGIAGGADVILIPEIPYDIEKVVESILARSRQGKRFSIVAVAEGAMSKVYAKKLHSIEKNLDKEKDKEKRNELKYRFRELESQHTGNTLLLSEELEELTGLESRVTILGHLQRGGIPSAADRLLATRLGTACVDYINKGKYGILVAARGEHTEPVPLEKVVNKLKLVPPDHPWVISARNVGTCLGD
jgi:6-phosphofructokinase